MGDYFERVVDIEATAEEAGPLAARVLDWLVAEGILTREPDREGMYSRYADEGFAAGPEWARALQTEPGWGPGPVAVITGRHHFVGGQGEDDAEYAVCPRCAARTTFIDYPNSFEADERTWAPFRSAVEAWEAGGTGEATCPACATPSPVTDWRWGDPYALGTVCFEFWGWPPLSDAFVADLTARLGHRTAQHMGKF
ncbi:hypothetical protein KV205_27050 [Streptomyces sp. SKN60]|uniref:hypothetical protein n=1 Tax=Streptomyces sp. SKN60 TaxID=2855506 RepID=UPI0022486306|nr:hypothetical protein [Streptomyces sp. SKN60]MCX2184161.1 hypothetical protein [Streptomyces sp. SKN60]